jgi:serine/threonine-protein kinase HipA
MVNVAKVKIWGELVGAVLWDQSQGLASFQYDTKFLSSAYELSPIKIPLRSGNRIYTFPELRSSRIGEPNTFQGLPGLLADALPDKYGTQLINVWLAQNGRPENSMNPVEKLCFIGSRGMGALEFEPSELKASKQPFTVEIKSLVNMAQKILSKREGFETNIEESEQKAMMDILKIGTSAGGARPKAVIAYNKKTGEVKSGQAKAPKGFEHWLLKLDGVSDAQFGTTHGWGRVEMAYHLMAKDCGIEMMECQLLEESNRVHFMTKRFDRESHETKHHVQTFCAIQHFDYNNLYTYSYEQLFQTMRTLKLSYPEAEQMFRRMVFNVLSINYDDHTKNFGFILKKGERWKLSPAYDVCYCYDATNTWVNQHTLSINGKHKNISKEDLLTIAKANNIKKGDKIIEEIKPIINNWNDYADKVRVDTKLRDLISNTIIALR